MHFMDINIGNAGGIIEDSIRALSYAFSEIIYDLIIWIYKIFERLCNARILDSDILKIISERVGIILGLIMLFMITFSIVQMVLEPDKLTDKEKGIGNIVKKVILVIVMLGVSNSTFRLLYGVQKNIIESNIMQKILLPYEINENVDFGGLLSSNLFISFYKVNTEGLDMDSMNLWENEDKECYNLYVELQMDIKENKGFSAGKECINRISKRNNQYIMSFNWVLLPVVGVVILYFIFSYCLSIGMRTIQLAFLEIISPMAIISYLSPKKDTMFQKWWKIYFSTYIDVFLRIMIINLVVFLITTLFEHSGEWEFWESVGKTGNFSDTAILILMIFALLTFAKKAPDLLKELFPSSASKLGLGVTSPKKLFDNMLGGNFVKGAAKVATVGTAIAGVNALASGFSRFQINKKNGKNNWQAALGAAGGVFSGLGRGFIAGAQKGNAYSTFTKGVKAQRDLNDKYDELITSGGSTLGKIGAGLTAYVGETKGQTYTRHLNDLSKIEEFKKKMYASADEMIEVKAAKDTWENLRPGDYANPEEYEKAKKVFGDRYRKLRNAYAEAALRDDKKATYTYKDINGNDVTNTIEIRDKDDLMYATDIEAVITEANSYSRSHNVVVWDESSKAYKTLGNITTRENLADAETAAHKTRTKITSEPDYNAAIADDKAAGVNSNGSGKK